ncbi:MAG: hypothetical protein ACJ8D6_05230 [Sphingomicrobium sp.]|jgi:hypothetical protein
MSGYRDTSNFDPSGSPRYGKPLRPYNWAQWLGVVFASLGVLGYLVYAADRLGWISIGLDSPAPFISLPLIGVALINSRREELDDPAPELAQDRKRWMLIIVALCAAILGGALVIEFTGA